MAVGGWEERIEIVSLLQGRALIPWARMRGVRQDQGGGKKIKGAGYEKNSGVRGVKDLTDQTYGEKWQTEEKRPLDWYVEVAK